VHSDPFRVATSQERSSGWGANGRSDEEVGKASTLGREPVDVWSPDGFRSEAAEVVVTLVIGKDDDEVGLFIIGGAQRDSSEKEGTQYEWSEARQKH